MNELQYKFFGSIINNINIEILEHGYLIGDTEWKFYNINSPFNRIYFIHEGLGHVQNKHEKTDLIPGNIYLIPLHTNYDYTCNSHMNKFYLHFKCELFPGNDIFSSEPSCMSLPFDVNLVEELIKKAESCELSDIAWCKAILLEAIYSFIKPKAVSIREDVRITLKYQNIFNYLKSSSLAKVTLNQLAAQMSMSVSNLSKSFKLDTGKTLKEYIRKQILQTAKEILVLENLSIKQVAYQLGFTDEFYFSRLFKKETGLSPKDYRYHNRMKYDI